LWLALLKVGYTKNMKTLQVDINRVVLSSKVGILKTASFIFAARNFVGTDLLISKVAESVILDKSLVASADKSRQQFYKASILDCGFYLKIEKEADTKEAKANIIFYDLKAREDFIRRGDRRFAEFLSKTTAGANSGQGTSGQTASGQGKFDITLEQVEFEGDKSCFLKLYRVIGQDFVYYPFLNEQQAEIAKIEDANVIVQGVAGSGKTNICIDKIVYSAARGYAGRVLYSTFSRGLLLDTKQKVLEYSANIKKLLQDIKSGRAVFADSDKVRAAEKKLGVYLFGGGSLEALLQKVSDYLENKVDYALIQDLYHSVNSVQGESDTSAPTINSAQPHLADEKHFKEVFLKGIKNHQLKTRLAKMQHISPEVIYKEIYGLITGYSKNDLSKADYVALRANSFSKDEANDIYLTYLEYAGFLKTNNLTNNNLMSRQLLEHIKSNPVTMQGQGQLHSQTQSLTQTNTQPLQKYSLVVLDEVQDFTRINLELFSEIALKMFCVGDALQMINASFFSFAHLKKLLHERDVSLTKELSSSYRNSKGIATILTHLGRLNEQTFGVHNFVVKTKAVEDGSVMHDAVLLNSKAEGQKFLDTLGSRAFNNYTIVVADNERKIALRERLKKQEILTVSEIKGLERECIILLDLLSANAPKWRALERAKVNKKISDENNIYRYYFNLFYVGLSRAKTALYVLESEKIGIFSDFLQNNFESKSVDDAISSILFSSDKLEAEQEELIERVREFILLGQYDNAHHTADRILSSPEKFAAKARIDIHKNYVVKGQHKAAGIEFIKAASSNHSLYEDARAQFVLAKEEQLISLVELLMGEGVASGIDVLDLFVDMSDNPEVAGLIIDIVKADLQKYKQNSMQISTKAKTLVG